MTWRGQDEDDVRVRPGKGKKPRSKNRPSHDNAVPAMVTAVDRGRITCSLSDSPETTVVAVKARELGRKAAVVGDRVQLVGDTSGTPDTLARLVVIDERSNSLRRTADDNDPYERIIVANADQMGIVVAVADPPPRLGLIDRCLVAAYDSGVSPLLILTKTDLGDPSELLEQYRGLDVNAVGIHQGGNLDELESLLMGKVTVLIGHSGVGKSTLVNALLPDAERATGEVNENTGRGRHTSTSAIALPLRNADGTNDGWIVDTPGFRSFGLAHVNRDQIVRTFSDLAAAAEECPKNCSHDEDGCALDAAVARGDASAERLESLRRILAALSNEPGS